MTLPELSLTGLLAESKLGWVLMNDAATYALEFEAPLAPATYAGQQVNITGHWVERDGGPVFVFTPEMRSGQAPIPAGIPVDSPEELAQHQTRRVVLVKTLVGI